MTDDDDLIPGVEYPVALTRPTPTRTITVQTGKVTVRDREPLGRAFWRAAEIANGERPANAAYTRLLREFGWIDGAGRPTAA